MEHFQIIIIISKWNIQKKTISIQRAVASVKNHVPKSKSPTLQHPGS